MRFNLLINGGLYNKQASFSAYQFAVASINEGVQISQVFFYQDGVSHATAQSNPLGDEFNAVEQWCYLAKQNEFQLSVCISASQRRGTVGNDELMSLSEMESQLPSPMTIRGLGEFIAACHNSDRTVSFS